MGVGREQGLEPLALLVGEQVGPGVQGAPGPVERIVFAATVAVEPLLDPEPALVQRVSGQTDQMERSTTAAASGSSYSAWSAAQMRRSRSPIAPPRDAIPALTLSRGQSRAVGLVPT